MNIDQIDFSLKWFLSTEGYYFAYRNDKYDKECIRATLYREKDDSIADDVRVSSHPGGIPAKSHHDIINHFEARLTLKLIN